MAIVSVIVHLIGWRLAGVFLFALLISGAPDRVATYAPTSTRWGYTRVHFSHLSPLDIARVSFPRFEKKGKIKTAGSGIFTRFIFANL